VLSLIFRASTTVRTLPVSYVVERGAVLVVGRRIGQDRLARLRDRTGNKIAVFDGKVIRDARGSRLGSVEGTALHDAAGRKLAAFDGRVVTDARGVRIGTMSEIQKTIEGPGGMSLVGLWYDDQALALFVIAARPYVGNVGKSSLEA